MCPGHAELHLSTYCLPAYLLTLLPTYLPTQVTLPQSSRLRVLPAVTCAACCVAQGGGLALAVAGEAAHLAILARDAFGNSRDCGGDDFEVRLLQPSGGGGGGGGGREVAGELIEGDVTPCGDGSATVSHIDMATSLQPCVMEAAAPCVKAAARCVQASYVATSAGEAQLRVTLAGEHIAGSPFATRVRAGSAAASCSSAHGERLRG